MLYEFGVLWVVLGPTVAIALYALWRQPQLWWASVGVLATGAVILLFLPVRSALHKPSGYDPVGDGFGIAIEFFAVLLTVGSLHLVFFGVLVGFAIVAELKRGKAR